MRNLIALTRREMGVYFVSPIAYIILTAFLGVSGAIFYTLMHGYASEKMTASLMLTFKYSVFILSTLCPLITMRLIAEEKNRGTIETLMTSPVTETQFVLAKYLASCLFTTYLLLPTVFYAVFVGAFGSLDVSATIVGYAGTLLTLGAVLAIGLFISSLANSQITAGVVTLIVTMILLLTSFFANSIKGTADWQVSARALLGYVAILDHVDLFASGIVDTRPLIYLSSVILFFLFVTIRTVESRRWR